MTAKQLVKFLGMVATVVVIILGGILIRSARVQAKDKDVDNEESKILQGFDIAPVPRTWPGRTGRWWD